MAAGHTWGRTNQPLHLRLYLSVCTWGRQHESTCLGLALATAGIMAGRTMKGAANGYTRVGLINTRNVRKLTAVWEARRQLEPGWRRFTAPPPQQVRRHLH